ncbi:MAG: DUF2815 family protein [Hydrogenophaga sp.]|nr:DUF2815 family protein [Hydrogenophaga sp.]
MGRIVLKNVRLAFPDIWKPGEPMPGSTSGPKYGAQLIFAPDSPAAQLCQQELLRAATEKWAGQASMVLQELGKDKKFLRRGDGNLAKDGTVRNGFGGMLYAAAKNKTKPAIIARNFFNGRPVFLNEDGSGMQDNAVIPGQMFKVPYGGCTVNAAIDVYAMDKVGQGKGVYATLISVQFVEDGQAFSGGAVDANGLEDLGDEPGAAPAAAASNLF